MSTDDTDSSNSTGSNNFPCVYDISSDEFRPVTQDDIARLELMQQVLGAERDVLKLVVEVRRNKDGTVNWANQMVRLRRMRDAAREQD